MSSSSNLQHIGITIPTQTHASNVLVSGASFAGLTTAFWMNHLGYKVTIVEIATGLKIGGSPVDIKERTVDIVRGVARRGEHARWVAEFEVRNAGGTIFPEPAEFGQGYYGFGFADPDGHKWNVFNM